MKIQVVKDNIHNIYELYDITRPLHSRYLAWSNNLQDAEKLAKNLIKNGLKTDIKIIKA